MAKPSDIPVEDVHAAVIGEIVVPERPSPEWSPADHIFIPVEGQETVGEFRAMVSEMGEGSSLIEFTVTDIPAKSLLADLENQDLELFDLNSLLDQVNAASDPNGLLVSVVEAMESDVAGLDSPQEAAQSALDQFQMNMAFARLAIVIDDESGADTVAI